MNRDFRILWFEDTKKWFEKEKESVERIIAEHFLIPNIDWQSGRDVPDSCLHSNQYDLIFVDLRLSDNVYGNKIIRQIRTNQIVTDVLFYSADTHLLYESLQGEEGYLDGVYVSDRDRDEFESKVESLVEKVVRRSEDIVNLRGFVLDNTSEFEDRVESLLNQYWSKASESERAVLQNKMIERYVDKHETLTEVKASAESDEDFDFQKHNMNRAVLGMQDRMRLLIKCSDLFEGVDFDGLPNFVEYYNDKIGIYRNRLGHVVCGGETIIIKNKEITVDEELFRTLRKNVRDVNEKLLTIEKKLDSF